ncbi:MAG: methyltransferase domain-containing protein [Methanobrevibacter sp.]|uniref:methyltransferase domain-containing protein n=1 Tax=Methanobrevibacter sp. TaxID=66852 RepID=UPI0026E08881|nr:methyltransferase domain-containing protein [Methanobrevibacter sp.]MDO5848363.1 methyltransferase domain-containing protein [Methanobrevibacter sp.]
MKFKTTPYHYNLLKDEERLSVFYEAIKEFAASNDCSNLVEFDVGCGSGILSYFSKDYFRKILAIEIDPKVADYTRENLKDFKNITVINEDATTFDFPEKADLIVCEMLDTALIDEEQVPALKNAKKYLNENGKIIPQSIVNVAELVEMPRENIHYDDVGSNTQYEILSNPVTYDKINFLDDFKESFNDVLRFKINKDGFKVNGIKITTFTLLSDNIICGPTPMLNPPLLIPIEPKNVKCNDLINLRIKYDMGEGIQTINVNYE